MQSAGTVMLCDDVLLAVLMDTAVPVRSTATGQSSEDQQAGHLTDKIARIVTIGRGLVPIHQFDVGQSTLERPDVGNLSCGVTHSGQFLVGDAVECVGKELPAAHPAGNFPGYILNLAVKLCFGW